ncbi:MAG: proline dehydrogenase family protein [Gemmatimonadetes bacterium]|jgi:proline dehydrogenase|nr:proline dehydrogenase family protein [Gemmatimonadota bacterium]MBK6842355.1 proline dehydrogenase family protein [Gemmatimonadota bacterium]MBK9979220.1 proline dehydrogenase family protein [Gemmatimonadota bacterium]HNV77027.1 proline dehydrogenase family protein [Gemmatimonadaceae bacterium]
MSLARNALLRASKSQWLASQMTQRAFARRAVKRFMPGEKLSDALDAAQTLSPARIGTIITRLGETLTGERNTDEVRDHYLSALGEIVRRKLPTQVSVKPTQLGLDLSVDECVRQIAPIAAAAAAEGQLLWIDMEDSSYVDRTLELYEKLKAANDKVGLCLQSYLFRTPKDLQRLLAIKPAIRMVKGAYAEPASVAFPAKSDTDAQYLSLGVTLLEAAKQGGAFPVFGTHDMSLIQQLVAKAAELGVAPGKFEIHMLYGIRSAEQRALAAQGHAVRCLISYGNNWFPWYMRRLAERPANVWFVVRSAFM